MTGVEAGVVAELPGPPWLAERRRRAVAGLDLSALPTPDEEIWRYSRIADLDLSSLEPLGKAPAELAPEQPPPSAASLTAGLNACGWVTARNGQVATVELDQAAAKAGVVLGDVGGSGHVRDHLGAVIRSPEHFVLLNDAFMPDAVVVDVPAGAELAEPIVVCHLVGAERAAAFPRTLVRVGPSARVDVVELVASGEEPGLAVPVTEITVGEEAQVGYVGLQLEGRNRWHIGYQVSEVGRDGTLIAATVALGGYYARTRIDSRLAGAGASGQLLAAYFASGTQMHDFRTLQDHDAPATRSELLFKGAVSDSACSVYSGLIRVRRGAAKTDAFQTNRNLVLSQGAHAHSVPNLDIEENEVRCSHASAVGPIDEEQRYYLETRGVPPGAADRLIALGFFGEVVDRLPVPALRPRVRNALATEVDRWSGRG